jgi:hypothetical protein
MERNYKELKTKMDPASVAENKQEVREELHRTALEELRGANRLTLRDEARGVFVNAILAPPTPSKAARTAASRYKKDPGR